MPSSEPRSTLFPYTTLFRSPDRNLGEAQDTSSLRTEGIGSCGQPLTKAQGRSEEHTSELQSLRHLVCRLPNRDLHSFPTRRSSDLQIGILARLKTLPR